MVYVGRICGSMTHDELRERFLQFGQVECVSLHFRETGSVCSAALSRRLADGQLAPNAVCLHFQ